MVSSTTPLREHTCHVGSHGDRGDIPAFTPAEAGTRFSDPGGMQTSLTVFRNSIEKVDFSSFLV